MTCEYSDLMEQVSTLASASVQPCRGKYYAAMHPKVWHVYGNIKVKMKHRVGKRGKVKTHYKALWWHLHHYRRERPGTYYTIML